MTEEEEAQAILDLIKQTRKFKKISQQEIAKELGISQDVYSKLERGKNELSIRRMIKIFRFLDIDANQINSKDDMIAEMYKDVKEIKKRFSKYDDFFAKQLGEQNIRIEKIGDEEGETEEGSNE
ncbi:MAG: helix-turn-helix transcriptional regulator [Bacteroidota bacterium]